MNSLTLDKNIKFNSDQKPSYLSPSFRGSIRVKVAHDISDNVAHNMIINVQRITQNIAQYIIRGERHGK